MLNQNIRTEDQLGAAAQHQGEQYRYRWLPSQYQLGEGAVPEVDRLFNHRDPQVSRGTLISGTTLVEAGNKAP